MAAICSEGAQFFQVRQSGTFFFVQNICNWDYYIHIIPNLLYTVYGNPPWINRKSRSGNRVQHSRAVLRGAETGMESSVVGWGWGEGQGDEDGAVDGDGADDGG